MRKTILLFSLLGIAFSAAAQGIIFEQGSWKEVLAKARKEKRLIYMDIYTTWCGPCKIMASQIFPDPAAGEKYNAAFINYKIDAEKGEGITLASQYAVEGYPTNLYINPEDESVVYRVMGSAEMDEFLHRADVAGIEYRDPMKWQDYEAKFAQGNREQPFLVAYLQKSERLDRTNDAVLDSYFERYVHTADDSAVSFLLRHTRTLDNKSMPFLYAHKEQIDRQHPDLPGYTAMWLKRLSFQTLEKAVALKDERLLQLVEQSIKKYNIRTGTPSGVFYFRKEFYSQTGNEQKTWEVAQAEADHLLKLDAKTYETMDLQELEHTKDGILFQLKAMKVAEEKIQSSLQATLDKNPDLKKSATLMAAETLNETAWKVFEQKRSDKAAIAQALLWSGKSLEMAKGSESWSLLADTYACLLYAKGDKAAAIAKEEEAIKIATERKQEHLETLKQNLESIKSGQL